MILIHDKITVLGIIQKSETTYQIQSTIYIPMTWKESWGQKQNKNIVTKEARVITPHITSHFLPHQMGYYFLVVQSANFVVWKNTAK